LKKVLQKLFKNISEKIIKNKMKNEL